MSLDGALLHCVREELSALVGARVEKVRMPSREEIVVTLRMLSGAEKGPRDVIFSANPASARVHLTTSAFDSPKQPPMLCMLLRKRLGGGKLSAVRQDGLERILFLDFDCVNEIGDRVVNTIAAEIMGRSSNILLLCGGKIVDSVRHVPDPPRRVLPNLAYELPPRQERLNVLECKAEDIFERLNGRAGRLAKALSDILEGISPIIAREFAFRACGDVDAACELSDEEKARFAVFFEEVKDSLNGGGKFVSVTDETGRKRDFSFVNIGQYGNSVKLSKFGSASELLEDFFTAESGAERCRQRSRELLKTLNTVYERALRKLELRKKELSECASREELKTFGDLINANIYRLEKGMTRCTLENFYGEGMIEIALDARLTPQQNAQKYYSEYRKLDNAEKKLSELIESSAAEVEYLDSVLDCAARAETDEELTEIKRELSEQGYLRISSKDEKGRSAKVKPIEPMRFISSDGYEILVGRNNRQNDLLTLKTARACDLWLHTKNIAGSHVIIRNPDGGDPTAAVPENTIVEAARLAAYHSKARSSSGVPVDCTAVKFVKKPAGAKPGMVIFTNNRTLYVTPDEDQIKSLKDNGKEHHQ